MKLPRHIPGNTIGDMAKDERERLTISVNFDSNPKLLADLTKEAQELAHETGLAVPLGAYIRMVLDGRPRFKLKKKK